MTVRREAQIKDLGIFTLAQGRPCGLSRQEISRRAAEERLVRLARGVYLQPEADLAAAADIGFQIAFSLFGKRSAIGDLNAFFIFNLAEQVPWETWMVVPPKKRTRHKGYRLIRTKPPVDREVVEENGCRIVTLERAVLEGLKFASKIAKGRR